MTINAPWTACSHESGWWEVRTSEDRTVDESGDGGFSIERAHLIAAAPDLLMAQTMGASTDTPTFLDWLADRLVHVYGEPANVDFVLSLRERAAAGRSAIQKASP